MSRPVTINGAVEIDRPVDEVFSFVVDQTNEPFYNPDMIASVKTTDGPIGVGTTFQARARGHGKALDMLIDVTDYEPLRSFETTTHMAMMNLDGGLSFEPTAAGTRMSWTWNVHPVGVWRWLRPFVRVIGARNERRIWTRLKVYLETTGQQSQSEHHGKELP